MSLKALAHKVLGRNTEWNKLGTEGQKCGTEASKFVPQCSTTCGTKDEVNDLLYEFNERLAIAEHDGGQTPLEAHRMAYLDTFLSILFDLSATDPQKTGWLKRSRLF